MRRGLVRVGVGAAVLLAACSSASDSDAGVSDVEEVPAAADTQATPDADDPDAAAAAPGGEEPLADAVETDQTRDEEPGTGGDDAGEEAPNAPVTFVGEPFVGACWDAPAGEFSFATAPLRSCEELHRSEVFWVGFPPLASLRAAYSARDLFDVVAPICHGALYGYQGGAVSESLETFVQLPSAEEWAAGRFRYSCSVSDGGGQPLQGSLRVETHGFPTGIVFAATERDAYAGLAFVRKDGVAIPQDVASPSGLVRDVAWFPDGQRVVFAARADGSQALNLYSLDGLQRPLVQLTDTFADNVSPAVSPDGTRIAFASARNGNLDLYVMDADGSNVQRLTETPGFAENSPHWSPDGSQIVFHRAEGVSDILGGDIYVMDADGSEPRLLASDPEGSQLRRPRWSPDGSRMAGERTVGGAFGEVVLIDARDGTLTSLLRCRCERPGWSPDGVAITYYVLPDPIPDAEGIWTLAVDGGEAEQVSVGAHVGPAWRPAP